MKRQAVSISSIILTLLLITVSIHSQALAYTNFMKFCPMNSNREVNVIETPSQPTYDWTAHYEDANKQRALLMVKAGNATSAYQFIVYQKDGTTITRRCTGTQNWTFMRLLLDFLFLSWNGNYYVCRYSPTGDFSPVQLSTSGLVNSSSFVSRLIPYYCQIDQGGLIYAILVEDSSSMVVRYTYLRTGSISAGWKSLSLPVPLAQGIGSYRYVWDKYNLKFWFLANDAANWTIANNVAVSWNNIIQSFALSRRVHVFAVQTSPKTDKLIVSNYDGNTFLSPDIVIQLATPSTTDLQYFTDNGYNFVRLASNELFWLTLPSSQTLTYYKSTITSAQIPDMSTILSIGFSKNMASVYYSSGKMEYYIHASANKIEKLFFSQATNGFIDTVGSKQYFIWFKCVCDNIRKYGFYSETLNGVILNKIGSNCQNFYTTLVW